MKKLFLFPGFVLLLVVFACRKNVWVNATIIRNCTGTYLRVNEKEFLVCNLEKTDGLSDSAKVVVNFHRIMECKGSAQSKVVCLMLYPHEGWVEVDNIKLNK